MDRRGLPNSSYGLAAIRHALNRIANEVELTVIVEYQNSFDHLRGVIETDHNPSEDVRWIHLIPPDQHHL